MNEMPLASIEVSEYYMYIAFVWHYGAMSLRGVAFKIQVSRSINLLRV